MNLNLSQRLAIETLIRRRDEAQATINDVLAEAGINPEDVENLNLATGEVTLKGSGVELDTKAKKS